MPSLNSISEASINPQFNHQKESSIMTIEDAFRIKMNMYKLLFPSVLIIYRSSQRAKSSKETRRLGSLANLIENNTENKAFKKVSSHQEGYHLVRNHKNCISLIVLVCTIVHGTPKIAKFGKSIFQKIFAF